MYEMVTGLNPKEYFNGVMPRHVNPYIPTWVEQIISKALHFEPEERFASVAEIEAVLLENFSQAKSTVSVIKEIVMGDKVDVNMGNLSNVSGQLYIGKFNNVITNLEMAGQVELANALRTLKEAVMASEAIQGDKKAEHMEVINQIGEEAVKNKPNRTLLKIISDGLLSTLKVIPDVAKAVDAVAPFFK